MSLSSTPTFCLGKPLLRLTNPFPFIQLQKDIYTKHLKYFFVHTIYIHSLRLQNRFFQPMQCDRIINEIGPLFGNPLLHTPQCINSLSTTRFWRNISLDVFDPLGALYTQENLDSCDISFHTHAILERCSAPQWTSYGLWSQCTKLAVCAISMWWFRTTLRLVLTLFHTWPT